MKLVLIPGLILITIVVVAPAQTRPQRLVGNLKNNAVADGCGCYFQFRGAPENAQRYIFFSSIEADGNKTAWMNIDGQDVKLKLEKKSGPFGTEREEPMGSRSTVKYSAGDITVHGRYTVTRVCARDDESCESIGYNVTFVVKKGSRSQIVKAKGGCGC